jgi:hypothetical protein
MRFRQIQSGYGGGRRAVCQSRCRCRLYSGLFYGTFGGGDIARLIDRYFHCVVGDFQ